MKRRAAPLLVASLLTAGLLATAAPMAHAVDDGRVVGHFTAPDGSPVETYVQFYSDPDDDGVYDQLADGMAGEPNGDIDRPKEPGTYKALLRDRCTIYADRYYRPAADGGLVDDLADASVITIKPGATVDLSSMFSDPSSESPSLCKTGVLTVAGVPAVGAPLTANPGSWSPMPTSFFYERYVDGVLVPGVTGSVFVPGPQDLGKHVHVEVQGRLQNSRGIWIDATLDQAVQLGELGFATRPQVTGLPVVRATLTASPGTPLAPATATYAWRRDGVTIPGATARTYALASADRGHVMSVVVRYVAQGFHPTTRVATTAAPVLGAATERIKVKAGKRAASFTVSVTPKASTHLKGTIAVRDEHGKKLKSVSIRSGKITFTVKHLTKGTHHYTVTYVGRKYAAQKTVRVRVA